MPNTGSLKVEARGDREIVMTRVFDAPRHLVYEAFTKPDLVKRWLGVFGGWSLPVCEIDFRVGGRYRFVWRKEGAEMGMGGVYKEIVPNERIVNTEKFDDTWYEGEGRGAICVFEPYAAFTPRSRPAMECSRVQWRAASPRATTSSPRFWRRCRANGARRSPGGDRERNGGAPKRPEERVGGTGRLHRHLYSLDGNGCGDARRPHLSALRRGDE